VVANLRLVSLEQVFEELAQADDGLRVATHACQVAPVLAVERSENKVAVFFLVTQESKRRE